MEIFAKQCLTNCLFEKNLAACEQLVRGRAGLGWGLALAHIYSLVTEVLAGKLPADTQPLLHRIEEIFRKRAVSVGESDLAAVQEFMRTTTSSEREVAGLLGVSGQVAEAYLSRDQPQACLGALARALALLQQDSRNIRLVKALFPNG